VTASRALEQLGLDPSPQGFGAATDLAWYGERGLPGFICGPGRLSECHVVDEYLEVEELVRASKLYGLFLTEWCA
jgi:acetylornithine deacetylase